MRALVLFVAGLLVGLAVQTTVAQNRGGVVMMNHVAVNVPNIPDAIKYYTEKMGYREAFRATNAEGQPTLVYMHISKDTFLELNQANAQRPMGVNHYGIHVENIKETVATLRQRGVMVTDVNVSANTKSLLANITDPYMGRIELVEITPDSSHRKAIDAWK